MQTEKEYIIGREINSLRCESIGEYSLPDYNGDVKKLLAVKTKVFPTGKFVGDEVLEFSGNVGYEVVYLDSENTVTHAELTTDYEAAVRINSESYVDSDIKTTVAGCNVRLVGPRKLSVKCSLDNDVCIAERRTHTIEGDAFMEYEPETVSQTAMIFSPTFATGETRELSEELVRIEGAIADEVEELLSDARFELDSIETLEDAVRVKGSIVASALVKNIDESMRLVSKVMPYSEDLSLGDADALDSLTSRVEVSGMKTSVNPLDDGVAISVSLSLTPKIYGRRNCRLGLITDSYLKERGTENEYSDFNYTEHICTDTKEDTLEVKRSLSELGIEAKGDVIYAEAQARVEKCEILDNTVEIQGEIRFSGIACEVIEGEAPIYAPVRFTVPFVENVNVNCQKHGNMRAFCAANANNAKIYIDENNVSASTDLSLFVTLNTEKRQRCLGASYLTDEEYLRDPSVVTVYYPDASESLFSIAKRFHTSVAAIAESNRLTESVFAASGEPIGTTNVRKLLIK